MITAYNEDCLLAMRKMKDNEFDLAIVDVPYGINAASDIRGNTQHGKAAAKSKSYGKKDWDLSTPSNEYWQELFRVSKNQIVWGANHFIASLPFNSPCWVVWDKVNGENGYADCELAWTSFKSAVRKVKFRWHGMLQQDMKNKQVRIHPTEKPVSLYQWLLSEYANVGDKILDTHGGSFSHAIACHNLGFDLTIFEIDKDYFDAGMKRLRQHQQQLTIF